VAAALTQDMGPRKIFFRLRVWAGVYDRDENGEPMSELGRLLDCPYCLGIWIAAVLAVLLTQFGDLLEMLLTYGLFWWALAGAQAAFQKVCGRV